MGGDKEKFDAAYTARARARRDKDEAGEKAATEAMIANADTTNQADLAYVCAKQTGHKVSEARSSLQDFESGTKENNTAFNRLLNIFS
jgi:hypothetical protein